jgi:hypothetical protein
MTVTTARAGARHRSATSTRSLIAIALVGAGASVPLTASGASAATPAGTAGPVQSVMVSSQSDRTAAAPLAGTPLTGNAYVFVQSPARQVQFFLDRPTTSTPTHIENSAAWDLVGGDATAAAPLDTATLSVGSHTLITRALDTATNYWSTATTTFTVGRPVAPSLSYRGTTIAGSWLPPTGFPGPATTGVPAGTRLTPSAGDLIIRTAGTVIDGLDIKGCVSVRANNVVIKNSRITCADTGGAVKMNDTNTNFLMQDSEIDGRGIANASSGNNLTMLRTEMHNLLDGPRIGSNVRYEANWIHDLVRTGDSHNDGFQTTGATDVVLRGNSVQAYSFDVNDPHNSAIMMGTEVGPALSNWIVEGNYFDGGAVMINMRSDTSVTGTLTFRNNQFGPNSRYQKSRLGLDRSLITWATTNTWSATGAYTTQ